MTFDDFTHIPPIDSENSERWYPIQHGSDIIHCVSTTTVIGYSYPKTPQLLDWMKKMGSEADPYRDAKAQIGTNVDQATELLDRGHTLQRDDFQKEEWKALVSYVRFVEDHDPAVLATQATVYDTRDRIAGTLDKVIEIHGEPIVTDIKVTSAIRPEHIVQVQTYARLLACMGIEVSKVGILRLGTKHKAGYEFAVELYDEQVYEQDFLACLHLWKRAHPKANGPYIERLPDTLKLPPLHADRLQGNGAAG